MMRPLSLLFNPFTQAPLSYFDPFFDRLFVDIGNRAKSVDELIMSYRSVETPLRLSVSGGRGYGKTTLLNAIMHQILKASQVDVKLLPIYCKISGIAYIRKLDEFADQFYNSILSDLAAVTRLRRSTFRKRVERYTRIVAPELAEPAISLALNAVSPYLTIVAPLARKCLDSVFERFKTKRIEDLLANPSIDKLHVLEGITNEYAEKEIKPVFIIDELDKALLNVLVRFFRSERRFFEAHNRIIIVALSTGISDIMSYAGGKMSDLQRIFDAPSPISLTPITKLDDAQNIIYRRLEWASKVPIRPQTVFPLPVVERILDLSDGVPASMMELCAGSVYNATDENASEIHVRHIPHYAKEFREMIDFLSSLAQTERTVLRKALERQVFASDRTLQDELKISRSRLSQILGKLERSGLMISRSSGRKKIYVVTDETKTMIREILRHEPEIFQEYE